MNRILVTFLLFQVFLISNGFGQSFSSSNSSVDAAGWVQNATASRITELLSHCQSSSTQIVLPVSEWWSAAVETTVIEESEEENKTNSKKHSDLPAYAGACNDPSSLKLMSDRVHGLSLSSFDTISDGGQRYLVIRVFRV